MTDQDSKHLKLLSTFHYIVAGITALFSLFPLIHVGLGIAMVTGKLQGENSPPDAVGWLFIVMGSVFVLAGFVFSGCLAVAGRLLTKRQHYIYCLVMAALACLLMPFGTVLGVFTILVLLREPVKDSFR